MFHLRGLDRLKFLSFNSEPIELPSTAEQIELPEVNNDEGEKGIDRRRI